MPPEDFFNGIGGGLGGSGGGRTKRIMVCGPSQAASDYEKERTRRMERNKDELKKCIGS